MTPTQLRLAIGEAFIRMPYYRNKLTRMGIIADTFETAITWDRFEQLYHGVRQRVGACIEELTGRKAMISCRFTHIYPDGPAPYFTFYAVAGDLASACQSGVRSSLPPVKPWYPWVAQ